MYPIGINRSLGSQLYLTMLKTTIVKISLPYTIIGTQKSTETIKIPLLT